MKISKIEKIDEYFLDVKAESIFKALKKEKLVGIKRSEIERLLKKYSINQVHDYLRTRYRKRNYFIIYSFLSLIFLSFFAGIAIFQYYFNNTIYFNNYLNFEYYKNLITFDYFVIFLAFGFFITLLLVLREIVLFFKRLK